MSHNGWTTADELNFIIELGAHSICGKRRSRLDLLSGYLEGTGQRVIWGAIEKDKVIKFAMEQLKSEVVML